MKFQVRQKIFSLGDSFTIKDETGADRYAVKGKVLSIDKKLSLTDMGGEELYFIRQKVLSLLPRYHLLKGGEVVAEVQKRLSFFKSRFTITGASGDYVIEGRPLGYDYRIEREGRTVATISKRFFALSDSYGVDIEDDGDPAFILCLVIVIDQVAHEKSSGD